jgi:hypothetical protein
MSMRSTGNGGVNGDAGTGHADTGESLGRLAVRDGPAVNNLDDPET